MKKKLNLFFQRIILFIYELRGIVNIKDTLKSIKRMNKSVRNYENNKNSVRIRDIGMWKKKMKKFIYGQPEDKKISELFFDSVIELKKVNSNFFKDEPILISLVKNDAYRTKKFFEHYDKLGVKNYAILDNGSTDETKDILESKNIDLFYSNELYTTQRREAWINRIIAHYESNKWFLIVDIDELLVFNDYHEKTIKTLVEHYERIGMTRARALMIDMYGISEISENEDAYSQMEYFDSQDYRLINSRQLESVYGGVRERILNKQFLLTKYPIIKADEKFVQGKSHFPFPYFQNKNNVCNLGLLHFKFIPSDFSKYVQIVKNGNYYNNSEQYKLYIENEKKILDGNLNYIGSKKLEDSNSIYDIDVLKPIEWGNGYD